ncbi:MAG: TonB-dependent receptor [Salibacteraceae bacterium]
MMRFFIASAIVLLASAANAQCVSIVVSDTSGRAIQAELYFEHSDRFLKTDDLGRLTIEWSGDSPLIVTVFSNGFSAKTVEMMSALPCATYTVALSPFSHQIGPVEVNASAGDNNGLAHMRYIETDGIYAAKKNEVIKPSEMVVNTATNNARQVFSKVPGINVQETDAGGLQLGVGSRGLDPKRSANFNTRQNGYDISADALGYPESYYTPPMDAVEEIQIVRGAASLQYGTQFGGLLNFRLKHGNPNRPVSMVFRQTAGSYENYSSFNSIGGTAGGWRYYGFLQLKRGKGWRPNSSYTADASYARLHRQITDNWAAEVEVTHFSYLAQQPGGLTDRLFETQPSASLRSRNWFGVNWNIAALVVNGKVGDNTTVNSKFFVLDAERNALGFLGSINRVDTLGPRQLIKGNFMNYGNETRLIRRFDIDKRPGAALAGVRLYKGNTTSEQGHAMGYDGPDFEFANPGQPDGSSYRFPSENVAIFSEWLLPVGEGFFVIPGIRVEYIMTANSGTYTDQQRHPLTHELLYSRTMSSASRTDRFLYLGGLGMVYRFAEDSEIYTNISQNYRAINFSDIRVNNPNLVVDSVLKDERGYTIDVGYRGALWHDRVSIDAAVYHVYYANRIGDILVNLPGKGVTRFRTNIADARFTGVEVYEELLVTDSKRSTYRLSWYNSLAVTKANYTENNEKQIAGNRVEYVPLVTYKSGLNFKAGPFETGCQFHFQSSVYSDATNAVFFPDATAGIIPSYYVLDLTSRYRFARYSLELTVNNLTDNIYFTRRATGYPGPGIIPAERRMIFLTLEVRI